MTGIKIDRIVRSKRRSLGLQVTPQAHLIVRAPERMPMHFIEQFIFKNQAWITKQQNASRERSAQIKPKEFVNGELFLYLGKSYPLAIVDDKQTRLSFDEGFRLSRGRLTRAKRLFISWYKNEAAKKIKERLEWYSSLSGLKYKGFAITSARKRWGSCTPCDNLNFSWRLIMAPPDIIDYVVSHELAHLAERNHSRRFWKKVAAFFPRFKESRLWLKANGHLLYL